MFIFVDSLPVPSASQLSAAGAVGLIGKMERHRVELLIANSDSKQDHILGMQDNLLRDNLPRDNLPRDNLPRDNFPQPLQPQRKVKWFICCKSRY